jgi:hypothetical protein
MAKTEMMCIKEKTDEMLIKNIVCIGYPRDVINQFSTSADVKFFSSGEFNFYEGNKNINFHHTKTPNEFAKQTSFFDVVYSNCISSYTDARFLLCAWVPTLRKNGIIIISGTGGQDILAAINHYVEQIDKASFEITMTEYEGARLVFIKCL